MKFLVTGANGFIGSNLVRRIVERGDEAVALVRARSDLSLLKDVAATLCRGDILDAASLDRAMEGVDVVVHVAGLASDWGPYQSFHDVNVTGTKNVMESAMKCGVKRVVLISSTAIHGFPGFMNAAEDFPLARTIWPYCETKKEAETLAKEHARKHGMPLVVIRPGNVFGPRDHTFFEKYAEALEKKKIAYVDGGRAITCPTYVENLVDAILLAARDERAAGETFIVTDGLEISWREFTEKIAGALRVPAPRMSIPFPVAYGAAALVEFAYRLVGSKTPPLITRYRVSNGGRNYHFSIERARRILGHSPRVGLDEAIRRSAEWYRKKKESL